MLRMIVLGAAAGGGLPQWNCACACCAAARAGRIAPATQASVAFSANNRDWFIVNASPDLRQQIAVTPALQPHNSALRHSPITGVILTNAEVDAVAGLLSLREGSPFTLYAHARVLDVLAENSMFGALGACVKRHPVHSDADFVLGASGDASINVTPFIVAAKEALYLEGSGKDDGDTLGLTLRLKNADPPVYIVPACATIDDALKTRLDGAAVVLFDGTLWHDDEMIAAGLSTKTGRRMGHLAMQDTIAALKDIRIGRRIFLHINNSNPVWMPDSAARARAERAGWEIAFDGMEIAV